MTVEAVPDRVSTPGKVRVYVYICGGIIFLELLFVFFALAQGATYQIQQHLHNLQPIDILSCFAALPIPLLVLIFLLRFIRFEKSGATGLLASALSVGAIVVVFSLQEHQLQFLPDSLLLLLPMLAAYQVKRSFPHCFT